MPESIADRPADEMTVKIGLPFRTRLAEPNLPDRPTDVCIARTGRDTLRRLGPFCVRPLFLPTQLYSCCIRRCLIRVKLAKGKEERT